MTSGQRVNTTGGNIAAGARRQVAQKAGPYITIYSAVAKVKDFDVIVAFDLRQSLTILEGGDPIPGLFPG